MRRFCTKRKHGSRGEAERLKASFYKRSSKRMRVYLCERCHYWHLTTSERVNKVWG